MDDMMSRYGVHALSCRVVGGELFKVRSVGEVATEMAPTRLHRTPLMDSLGGRA